MNRKLVRIFCSLQFVKSNDVKIKKEKEIDRNCESANFMFYDSTGIRNIYLAGYPLVLIGQSTKYIRFRE